MIRRLIELGKLETYDAPHNPEVRLLRRTDVKELAHHWKSLLTLPQTAEMLRVGREIVEDLVNVGLLVAEHSLQEGFPRWRFSTATIENCITMISCHTTELSLDALAGAGDDYLNLDQAARSLARVGLTPGSILLAVTRQELPGYWIPGNASLASLVFLSKDVDSFITTTKLRNGWIDRKEAADILGASEQAVMRWVRSGLIPVAAAYLRSSVQYFDRDVVNRFAYDTLSLQEAANIIGVHTVTLRTWIRKGRFKAGVRRLKFRGSTYSFSRPEVVAWRHEHMHSNEAAKFLETSVFTLCQLVHAERLQPIWPLAQRGEGWFRASDVIRLKDEITKDSEGMGSPDRVLHAVLQDTAKGRAARS